MYVDFEVNVGDVLTRVQPPCDHNNGYCHNGVVVEVNKLEIIMEMLPGRVERVRFNKRGGFAQGSERGFLARPDFSGSDRGRDGLIDND